MNRILLLIVIAISSLQLTVQAQQDAQYTQYMFNGLVLNPAYAGSRDATSITAIYRNQWVNIDKAPKTFSASVHGAVGERNGLGIFLETDKIGVHNRTTLFGSYAYKLPLNDKLRLSLGVQGGFLNYNSDWTEALAQDSTDPLLQESTNKILPNFGLGAYLYSERFYLGFSVPHLLDPKLDGATELARQYKHYFLTSGVVIDLTSALKLKPVVLFKSVPAVAPLEVDINLNLLIKDALWLGVGYRTQDAMMFLMEYQFKNGLRIGYSYDYTLSELGDYNSGSHEIMLGWDLVGKKQQGTVLSPRFF